MIYRSAQQIRLWIYWIALALMVIQSFSRPFTATDFAVFMLVGALPFLEVCPVCRRLAWWESNKWPNALWISTRCRGEPHSD